MKRRWKKICSGLRIRLRCLRLRCMRMKRPPDAKSPETMLREMRKKIKERS